MKRLKRNEEGVSPVIATILMVAITVVLAATLYMMVGDFGDDTGSPVGGRIRHRDGTQFAFESLGPPSSADPDDVEITVLDDDGVEKDSGTIGEEDWSLLDGDEVVAGSRFDINDLDDLEDTITIDDIEEIVIRIRGYSGTIDWQP